MTGEEENERRNTPLTMALIENGLQLSCDQHSPPEMLGTWDTNDVINIPNEELREIMKKHELRHLNEDSKNSLYIHDGEERFKIGTAEEHDGVLEISLDTQQPDDLRDFLARNGGNALFSIGEDGEKFVLDSLWEKK